MSKIHQNLWTHQEIHVKARFNNFFHYYLNKSCLTFKINRTPTNCIRKFNFKIFCCCFLSQKFLLPTRDTEPLANNSELFAASQLRRLACLHCVNQASCSGGFGRCGYQYTCINHQVNAEGNAAFYNHNPGRLLEARCCLWAGIFLAGTAVMSCGAWRCWSHFRMNIR